MDALPHYVDDKNIALFERQKVYTRQEVQSRYEVKLENYVKVIDIEALSMIDMARRMILPASLRYARDVAQEMQLKLSVLPGLASQAETALLTALSEQNNELYAATEVLDQAVKAMPSEAFMLQKAEYTRDVVIAAMVRVRAAADALETLTGADYWPMPTYQEILTSV